MSGRSPIAPDGVFVERLLSWFSRFMRPLPWRKEYSPYSVWISEIMLQQTQMERGVRYFNSWMRRFPSIRSVAEAREEEILAAWEGLGYYSRARNLHAAAKRVMAHHCGEFPNTIEAIRSLPGVGEYTAGAIAAIAFNIPEPAVDANVLRIFARIRDIDAPVAGARVKQAVTDEVRALIPVRSPRMFCQALMEFGALVCGKNPACGECPVTEYCAARANGTVALRPRKQGNSVYHAVETAAAVLVRNGLVLVRRRPEGGLWGGMWELPGGEVARGESPEQALRRLIPDEMGMTVSVGRSIASIRYGYTTHRAIVHGYFCGIGNPDAGEGSFSGETRWASPEELAALPFPAGHRKLIERLVLQL